MKKRSSSQSPSCWVNSWCGAGKPRSKKATPPLLEKIWREAPYRDYFAVDLARNSKTPAAILAEVAKGHNLILPEAVLAHPALNCEVVRNLISSLEHGYLSAENKKYYLELAQTQESQLCR